MRRLSAPLTGRHQDVAGAADRLDDPRIVDVRLELLAQPPDLDVDGPVERRRLAPAGLLEQEVAGQDAAGMGEEDGKQVELAAGQRHLPPAGIEQPARRQVELPVGEAIAPGRRLRRGRAGRGGRGQGPAQHRLDPRQQLAQVERLGDVVVGADFEADDLVDRIAPSGDDDEAAVPVLAQLPGDREPVLAGQAEVEQHQVGRIGRHEAQQRRPGVRLGDAIALALQVARKQTRDLCVVVEDCDVDCGAHRGEAGRPRARPSRQNPSVSASPRRPAAARRRRWAG